MKLAIMQPYFLPYIGYFQLINAVDKYVIYDNIEYTKKGWINRNRILMNGTDFLISLPLKKDSDYKLVCERELSSDYNPQKMLGQIRSTYLKAPYFKEVYSLLENIFYHKENNLFKYILNSVNVVNNYLCINTEIVISSTININHQLKSEDKVLAICKSLGANSYYNAIGGKELYSKERFLSLGIDLKFLSSDDILYKQFDNTFVPWLSIVDVLMFNSKEEVSILLKKYTLQ